LQINNVEDRLIIFNLLKQDQSAIEAELGGTLDWEEKPQKKTSHIVLRNSAFNPKNRKTWPEQQQWMMEKLAAFKKVFGQRIKNMDPGDWQPEDVEDRA
jgi:hypothetical protein